MKTEQAKQISLIDLLSFLGHAPKSVKKNGNEFWFISPFRDEKTASFKVKKDDNIWFDHGQGKGGNIFDFVMLFKNIDFKAALFFLGQTNLTKNISEPVFNSVQALQKKVVIKKDEDKREIIEIKPLFSYALKAYIDERGIKPSIALKYLQELKYKFEGKIYFALAFKNRGGGWELRSSSYKGVIGVKDITIVKKNFERVSVFEGFMDFLSYLTMKGDDNINSDFIVLNSASMVVYSIDFIKGQNYKEVYTFLNNDIAGRKAYDLFKAEIPVCISYSHLYAGFNDLNDFLKARKVK